MYIYSLLESVATASFIEENSKNSNNSGNCGEEVARQSPLSQPT